jgi:hypothetical protein
MLYSCVLSPELLEIAAAASSMALQTQIGKMLNSITCTTVPCEIHQWYADLLSSVKHSSKHPQGADIEVPNASSIFDDFIDRNCNVLPLSLEDLLNYTTLMLKFCTNKPIWASLMRQVFFWGGKGAFYPKIRCNTPSTGYGFPRKKILRKLITYCKLL